jgi:hypothetical protein
MGGSESKPRTSDNKGNKEVFLHTDVQDQIQKLNKYVDNFNKSDVNALLDIVNQYSMRFKKPDGERYDLRNVEYFISEFYKDLKIAITNENPSLESEQIDVKIKEKLQNNELPLYLKTIYDKNFQDLKDEINSSIQDSKSQKDIESIFSNISTLKSKYRYFEYKYIELNIFMIIFIQHTFQIMDKFVSTVISHVNDQDKQSSNSIKKLVSLLLEVMKRADLQINKTDFDTLDSLMSVMKKELQEKKQILNEGIEKAKTEVNANMVTLLNNASAPDNQPLKRSVTTNNIDQISAFPSQQQVKVNLGDWQQTENITGSTQNIRVQPISTPIPDSRPTVSARYPGTNLLGGFVRGHSRFPQAFYDLNKRS